ncbi:MAG: hypothetical protein MJZ05_09880 [Fibrobacter sp.]|nr:hypothetical protein [Fibrobacter sp.]
MKLSTILTRSLLAMGFVALVGCDDGSSPSDNGGNSSSELDCSVSDGTVVVSPKGGETFKMGDKIKVVFGTDVKDGTYRIMFRANEDSDGMDLLEKSIPAKDVEIDGKTCNTVEVVLDEDHNAEVSDEAWIVVRPYSKTAKQGVSKAFKVTE